MRILATNGDWGPDPPDKAAYGTGAYSVPVFLTLRDFYTGECVDGPGGYRYLAVAAAPKAGDVRRSPLDLGHSRFTGTLGLHVVDMQFPMGDLVDLVARKAKGGVR